MMMKIKTLQDYNMQLISETITKVGAVVLAFLLPIQTSIYLISALVIADTILTLVANKKEDVKFDENKFDLLFYKTITYLLVLMITHAVTLYFQFDSDLIIKTLTSIICIKELNSMDSSIEKIVGFSTFKFIINKLQAFIKK